MWTAPLILKKRDFIVLSVRVQQFAQNTAPYTLCNINIYIGSVHGTLYKKGLINDNKI